MAWRVMTVFILTRCRRPARAPLQPLVTSRAVWRTNGRKARCSVRVTSWALVRGSPDLVRPAAAEGGRIRAVWDAQTTARGAVCSAVQCSALHCTRHRSTVQHSTPADAVRVLCGALCLLSCAVLCRANNVRHHAAADAAAGLVPVPREHGRQLQRGRGVPDEQPGPRRPGMCVCVCVCVCMCVCATARVRLCDHVLAWSSRGHTRSRSRSPSLALVRVRLLSLSLSFSPSHAPPLSLSGPGFQRGRPQLQGAQHGECLERCEHIHTCWLSHRSLSHTRIPTHIVSLTTTAGRERERQPGRPLADDPQDRLLHEQQVKRVLEQQMAGRRRQTNSAPCTGEGRGRVAHWETEREREREVGKGECAD